jgi:signal transduction histidine kinase
LALVTAIALGLIGLTKGAPESLGELTTFKAIALLGGWWCTFALATATFYWFGPSHRLSHGAADSELFSRSLCLVALMVLTGQARMPFLFLNLVSGYVWRALPEARVRTMLTLYVLSHAIGLVACLSTGRFGAATVVFLSACAVISVQTMLNRAARRSSTARAERDLAERELLALEVETLRERIARELHDGLGSDLTALVLRLRDEADGRPELAALLGEAQSIFEELRISVWLLKRTTSTFDDLAQLIDASCKRLCQAVSYQRECAEVDLTRTIEPSHAALAARAAQALVRCAVKAVGVHGVRLRIAIHDGIALTVEAHGAASTEGFELVETVLARASGSASCVNSEGGLRLSARFPLAPVGP